MISRRTGFPFPEWVLALVGSWLALTLVQTHPYVCPFLGWSWLRPRIWFVQLVSSLLFAFVD